MDLEPDQQAFVDAAMRPLGDDPVRRELLEECVAVAASMPFPPRTDDIRMASERLLATSSGFKTRHLIRQSVVIGITLAVLWLALIGPAAIRSLRGIWIANSVTNSVGSVCCARPGPPAFHTIFKASDELLSDPVLKHLSPKLSDANRLILLGDIHQSDPVIRWKRVRDAYPQSPEHYFAYAQEYRKANSRWPDDLVETGERLDPGNGWFRLMQSGSRMKAAIGDAPPRKVSREEELAARAAGKPPPLAPTVVKPERIVLDASAYRQAWTGLEQALAMPRLDDYRKRLDLIRWQASPRTMDFPDYCAGQVMSFVQPEESLRDWLDLRSYVEAMGFEAKEAGSAGDKERLGELDALLERTVRSLGDASSGLLQSLVTRNLAKEGAVGIAKGWTAAGDPARAKRLEDLGQQLDLKRHPAPPSPPDALDEDRGNSLIATGVVISSKRSPASAPVTEPQLRGGRLAEYALYERLMLHVVTVLLLAALAFLGCMAWRERRKHGLLPARLAGLLEPVDVLWIAALGVALPAGLYAISTRLPWFEPRDFSLSESRFYLWLAQAVALVLSVVLVTLQTARWRLGRRGAVLALGRVGPDPGRFCTPLALAAIPFASLLPRLVNHAFFPAGTDLACIGMMLAFPLLWAFALASGCFHGPPARALHRAVLMQAARPYLAVAMLLPVLAMPWIHQEEKYWTSQLDFDALGPGQSIITSRLELEYADWIRDETLRRLDEAK